MPGSPGPATTAPRWTAGSRGGGRGPRPVVTTWLQGTSRDGEPHDHSHNVIARMALTDPMAAGARWTRWRCAASLARWPPSWTSRVHRRCRASSASAAPARADGRGPRDRGHPARDAGRVLDAHARGDAKPRRLARQWERKHGRAPNAREMTCSVLKANLASRQGKDDGPIDWDALAAEWDATIGGQLAAIAETVCDFGARPDVAPSRQPRRRPGSSRRPWPTSRPAAAPGPARDLMRSSGLGDGPGVLRHGPDARQEPAGAA